MRNLIIILCASFTLFSCGNYSDKNIEKWEQEITETELSFSKMAGTDGIKEAFLFHAAEDAVLMRNNTVIEGKTALEDHFSNPPQDGIKRSLVWAPDFVSVSSSGDMAYTYGEYTYTQIDSLGDVQESKGIFHTVWKRQENGDWKFVWD